MIKNILTPLFLFLICIGNCYGEDTTPHLTGKSLIYTGPVDEQGNPIVIINDFRNLPYDYAKKLPPELYYWWAKSHNQNRQEAFTLSSSPSVLQIRSNATSDNSYGLRSNGNYVPRITGRSSASSRQTTTIRSFQQTYENTPARIYNPYFK